MSDQMPGTPGEPPQKNGLSKGAIIAIAIVGLALLVFGTCVFVAPIGG